MEEKIIAAIERLSFAFRILLWDLAKRKKLSPIQIQFLIFLNSHSQEFCRVTQLAREFDLTKATVSEAIKSLKEKKLTSKKVWQNDFRISNLKLTPAGKSLAKEIGNWPKSILSHLKAFPPQVKQTVMIFLMELIASLQKSGIISVARMCITCRNFKKDAHPRTARPHYCRLTDRPISNSELKIDCQRHKPGN